MRGVRGVIGARFGLTHRALVVGALFALARPCGAQLSPAQRDSIQAQVQAALDSLTDAWRRWDVDGMMRFYLDSALVAGNGRLSSQAEHRAASARRIAVQGQKIGPFRPIRFDVLSRDAVVVSWLNTFAVIDTGGRARPAMIAASTDVWVRRGRAWRILVQHESTRIAPDSAALPPPVPPSAAASVPRADSTVVILLGTGNPNPDPDAAGPATAIVVGSRVFLFDAGAGVMRRVRAAKLQISGPTALFITHLHSDHTLGLPDVIFTTWVMGRKTPLEVYGPHGLQAMTDHIIAAWQEDIDIRTNGLEHRTPNGYAVRVHEISPGVVYDSAGVRITAIPVLHGSWKEAYGYRVDTPDRSIVLSGDTRPSSAIEQAARDVDVLIHEVYPESANSTPQGAAFAPYRRAFHTSDVELGRLAAAAKPKMLVLYHHGVPADGGEKMVSIIHGEGYQGRIIFGKDLDRF